LEIAIKDQADTFVAQEDKMLMVFQDGSKEEIAGKNLLQSYLLIVSQMFFDHEERFAEIDKEKTKECAEIFQQLYRLGFK
jgi:hypothetical protein